MFKDCRTFCIMSCRTAGGFVLWAALCALSGLGTVSKLCACCPVFMDCRKLSNYEQLCAFSGLGGLLGVWFSFSKVNWFGMYLADNLFV